MKREKILLLALPGIGDALLATPMIELLRRSKPDAEIHALVMFAATRDMFSRDPHIDRVHFYDFVKGSKVGALNAVVRLRSERFSTSINIYPQNRREYNLISRLIGARRRLGVHYRRRNSQNMNWLNTASIVEDDSLHCVEQNVKLLSLIGIDSELTEADLPRLRLNLADANLDFANSWITEHELSGVHPIIGMHAGTALFKNHIKRRWAPEKFGDLAIRLTEEFGAKVLLFGGPDDTEANLIIQKKAGSAIIPVETKSILDSVAIMQNLDGFISNDSSLMHIAGALQLPTVAIFGPTNEVYVHPWKTRYAIVETGIDCRPCFVYSPKPLTCYRQNPAEHYRCIRDIQVEDVMAAYRRNNYPDLQLPIVGN